MLAADPTANLISSVGAAGVEHPTLLAFKAEAQLGQVPAAQP
jgi:hypothetical protein